MKNHKNRDHALLSASSSSRWLKCPPSAVYASIYPNVDTEYTREGTLAHEVAEWVSRHGDELTIADLRRMPGMEDAPVEMYECATGYRDYIQEQVKSDAASVLLEQRLDFSPWVPDGFGTGDCIIVQGNRLDVIDYKYGQGVAVSAVDNSQMRLYGLGALNDYGDIYDIGEVVMHIYQPRMNNVSTERLTRDELLAWGETVKPIAHLAAVGEGDACAGEHCRFCPHAGVCPTLATTCMRIVNANGGAAVVPTLAPWMVADILKLEPMISKWLKAVKDRALASLLDGEEIPGYKVVEGKQGNRKWTDEGKVVSVLKEAGYGPDDYYETNVLSPAGMDKSIGKKKVSELLGSLIDRSPGAPTVVSESDKRKPLDRLAEAQKDFE